MERPPFVTLLIASLLTTGIRAGLALVREGPYLRELLGIAVVVIFTIALLKLADVIK